MSPRYQVFVCACVCMYVCASWVLCYLGSSDGGASKSAGYSLGSLRYCRLIGWGVSQANRLQTLMWRTGERERERERGAALFVPNTNPLYQPPPVHTHVHTHTHTHTHTHMHHANSCDPLRLWWFINFAASSLVSLCLATCFSFGPPCLFVVSLYKGNVEGNWPKSIQFFLLMTVHKE